MVEKAKALWAEWIPGWFPIFLAIIGAAFWIGQQQQNIIDRLSAVEMQVKAIQEYLRTSHAKGAPEPPISGVVYPQAESQDAGSSTPAHY